jgi:hypothetical protein
MRPPIPLILIGLLTFSPGVLSAEIYLEGISILGAKKKAFVTLDGENLAVSPGEALGDWLVERIEPRSIFLRKPAPEGQPEGELKELELHNRLAEEPAASPPLAITPPSPFGAPAEGSQAVPLPPVEPFQPRRIAPEDVPPGHHVVNTPFGDVLVKDQPEPPVPPGQ